MYLRAATVLLLHLALVCEASSNQQHASKLSLLNHKTRVPSKWRYAAASNQYQQQARPFNVEQIMLGLEPPTQMQLVAPSQQYRINQKRDIMASSEQVRYDVLDNEDRSLLDKFYRETKSQDPFQSKQLISQDLWNPERNEVDLTKASVGSGVDHVQYQAVEKRPESSRASRPGTSQLNRLMSLNDWTIDPQLIEQSENLTMSHLREPPPGTIHKAAARYSPTLKLLTSYDPIEESVRAVMDTDQERGSRGNRVVGATLYGTEQSSRPNVSSKSPELAIKLHDELLEEPPRDGKVRVRIYFHRAIHDDVKLYGTGPWKYWGHGWGVEFGYDPKNVKEPNYYQKGYTIERAYGRDFCRDQKNCRPPDRNFYEMRPLESVVEIRRIK